MKQTAAIDTLALPRSSVAMAIQPKPKLLLSLSSRFLANRESRLCSQPTLVAPVPGVPFEYLYEVTVLSPPPMIDLLDTPASKLLGPERHEQFLAWMRKTFRIFSSLNRICLVSILAMWLVPAKISRVVTLIATFGCFPVVLFTVALMNRDILRMVVKHHEFWVFTLSNANMWIIAAIWFNDTRSIGCIPCFLVTELVILMDANYRTVITSMRSGLLWIPSMICIVVALGTKSVDIDPRRFDLIIPKNKIHFTLANSFVNTTTTLVIYVMRKTLRRRKILSQTFLRDRMMPCSVIRSNLVLKLMNSGSNAAYTRFETLQTAQSAKKVVTQASGNASLMSGRCSAILIPLMEAPPPPETSNRLTKQMMRVTAPTLAFLDMRNTVFPSWTPKKPLGLTWLVVLYANGLIGLVLGGLSMYFGGSESFIVKFVPALSLVATLIFFVPFCASFQRELVDCLVHHFDFLFSSLQFTLGCLCLADMVRWDQRSLAILSWVIWFHWILFWDALTPAIRDRFGFVKMLGAPVLVGIQLGIVWTIYSLLFSDYDELQDRILCNVGWGNINISFRTSTFLIGRLSTILTWSLRLVWKSIKAEKDELIFIRGLYDYHSPHELIPAPMHDTSSVAPLQLVVPAQEAKAIESESDSAWKLRLKRYDGFHPDSCRSDQITVVAEPGTE